MQRDIILLIEMVDAAEQAQRLVAGFSAAEVGADRMRRDSLLWNFTVLGEVSLATLVSSETKARFPDISWRNPARLRNRVVHGYWSVDSRSCTRPPSSSSASSPDCSARRWLLSNRTGGPTREVTCAVRSRRGLWGSRPRPWRLTSGVRPLVRTR
jgi:uncharacterized protein with HEPN domain